MQILLESGRKRLAARIVSLVFAFLLAFLVMLFRNSGLGVQAASELTSIGLAEHGLKAYREGWLYEYGAYGNFNSNGVRTSDCSGLIYSYLCWVDDNSNVVPNYSMPRGVNSQINASSVHGTIDNIPRTHGLILTFPEGSHVGIYLGNGIVVDNSTWGVNMLYESIYDRNWVAWHKLDCLTYPTTGWYRFDGDYFYYIDGEYVVNTTLEIDGVTYTFGSDGVSDRAPQEAGNSGYAFASSEMNARVTGEGVRLRKGPGLTYDTLAYLQKNAAVNVTSTANPDWYAVTVGTGQNGYMSSQYISIVGEVPTGTATEGGETGTLTPPATEGTNAKTTTAVHLRTGMGTDTQSLGVIPASTAIAVINTSDPTWYAVTVNGKTGFMHSDYIDLVGEVPSQSGGSSAEPGQTQTPADSGTLSVPARTTAAVHLRDGPGTTFPSLEVVPENTEVTVTRILENGQWLEVTVGGKVGYMSGDYVLPLTAVPQTGSTGSTGESLTGKTTEALNLRAEPNTGSKVLTVIPKGGEVKLLSISDPAWYRVSYNNKEGYVSSQYIQR